jgi:hypothetical protein
MKMIQSFPSIWNNPPPMNKLDTVQSISFWDVTPCSLVVYRLFRGMFYLNYRGQELVMHGVHSSEILVNFYQESQVRIQ